MPTMGRFRDRVDAGDALADELLEYAGRDDVLVLALPRGGVPVAAEIAKRLDLPMDVFLVRKLGLPGHEELAMGAIASGGTRVMNAEILAMARVEEDVVESVARRERAELERREREYRGGRPEPDFTGQTVILVDDGLATGSTMRAAVQALRQRGPRAIVVAVPVAARETCDEFRNEVDRVVCALTPEPFHAVGLWYNDFSQTTDHEVRTLLRAASERAGGGKDAPSAATTSGDRGSAAAPGEPTPVRVQTDDATLDADLTVPQDVRGFVIFAHGSGSSRRSPRNRSVARELNEAGLGTLLLDLLTPQEEETDLRTRHLRFDIEMLAGRLVGAANWLARQPVAGGRSIGFFGASTGAGAALVAAAAVPDSIAAVVSRGGRPDLAGNALPRVRAPTLLLVGSEDVPVLGMNRDAMAQMTAKVQLEIVPGAGHLFEEPGKLETVSELARDWFIEHLVRAE